MESSWWNANETRWYSLWIALSNVLVFRVMQFCFETREEFGCLECTAPWNKKDVNYVYSCRKKFSDFSLRITSGFCRLPFSWSAFVPFVIAVRSSHFFLAVTPLFWLTFSRLLEELIFSGTKRIKTHYSRRKCIILCFRQLSEGYWKVIFIKFKLDVINIHWTSCKSIV